jgi:hypothetical protein
VKRKNVGSFCTSNTSAAATKKCATSNKVSRDKLHSVLPVFLLTAILQPHTYFESHHCLSHSFTSCHLDTNLRLPDLLCVLPLSTTDYTIHLRRVGQRHLRTLTRRSHFALNAYAAYSVMRIAICTPSAPPCTRHACTWTRVMKRVGRNQQILPAHEQTFDKGSIKHIKNYDTT